MRPGLAIMVLLTEMALPGCLGSQNPLDGGADLNETGTEPGPDDPPPDDEKTTPPPRENDSSRPPAPRPVERDYPPWPALDEAKVRPGVQITAGGAQCTSNFLFRTPDNATLFLGVAAHCVSEGGGLTGSTQTNGCDTVNEPFEVGASVEIEGAASAGTVAYTSWRTMQELDEKDDDACAYNDFALIAIAPDDRPVVHPAMFHFGGPTDLAASNGVNTGDKVLTYGRSGLRPGIDETNWHEGYVLSPLNAWSTEIYTVAPGVPGDSGSGVLMGSGRALGVLVTIYTVPPAANGVTSLDKALAYAAESGMMVELVTWKLLDGGILP